MPEASHKVDAEIHPGENPIVNGVAIRIDSNTTLSNRGLLDGDLPCGSRPYSETSSSSISLAVAITREEA